MAVCQRVMQASVAQVFAVLADAHSYDLWVVGAQEVRDADSSWPQAGSFLHHSIGFGPVTLKDDTKVLECQPPHRLVLEARARPVGIARVEFDLAAEGSGSRIVMTEAVIRPSALALLNPLFDPLVRARNTEALRRLEAVVVKRGSTDGPGGSISRS